MLGIATVIAVGASVIDVTPVASALVGSAVEVRQTITDIARPETLSAIGEYVGQNDQAIARVITGVFLLSDILQLPGDIITNFLWRSLWQVTLFSETTIEKLTEQGHTMRRGNDISVLTIRGKITLPVYIATTPNGSTLTFVPVRRHWWSRDWEGAPFPPDMVLASVSDAVTKPLPPLSHLFLRAVTSRTTAFLVINGLAQVAGNALGILVSPWTNAITAPAAVTYSITTNLVASAVSVPIRVGYLAIRSFRFALSFVQGKFTANSPVVTQIKEALQSALQAIQGVFKKGQSVYKNAKDEGCFSQNPFVERVYAAKDDERKEGNTCKWFLRPQVRVLGVIGLMAYALQGSMPMVDALYKMPTAYAAFVDSLRPPPLPEYSTLPHAPVAAVYCSNGAVSQGCDPNMEPGFDGTDEQCCVYKKTHMTACSARGYIFIKGDKEYTPDGVYYRPQNPNNIPGGSPTEKINYLVNQFDRLEHNRTLSPQDGGDDSFPLFYTCSGTCDPTSGCSQLATTCPQAGLVDFVGDKAFVCQTDGNWKPLSDDESRSIAAGQIRCSSDGRSVEDIPSGQVLQTCGLNDTCLGTTPAYCQPTGAVFGCSTNQKYIDGGLQCTPAGKICTPNESIPLTQEYPCQRQCNAEGTGLIYAEPYTCAPSSTAYTDRACSNSQVFEVRSDQSASEPVLVEQCTSGCSNGLCNAFPHARCSEGQISSDALHPSSNCPLVCRHGRFVSAPWCGKVDVLGYNDESRYTAYAALNLLPDGLFSSLERFPVVMSWMTSAVSGGEGQAIPPFQSGEEYYYTLIGTYDEGIARTDSVIHEFFHVWALQQGQKAITPQQYNELKEQYTALGFTDETEINWWIYGAPSDFVTQTHCSKTPLPQSSECVEAFAYGASKYVHNPCELLSGINPASVRLPIDPELGKARYDYFRTEVFGGREYLPPGGCPK